MWTMLQCTNEIACIEMKRFIVFIQSSSHVGPAWKASGSPVSSIAAYTGMYRLSWTGSWRMLVTRKPQTLGLPANSRIMRRHMSGSLRGRNGRNLSRGSWLQNSSTIQRLYAYATCDSPIGIGDSPSDSSEVGNTTCTSMLIASIARRQSSTSRGTSIGPRFSRVSSWCGIRPCIAWNWKPLLPGVGTYCVTPMTSRSCCEFDRMTGFSMCRRMAGHTEPGSRWESTSTTK